ncbi:MAG: tRNA lysidine(34) synthetase TilS [Rhizobiaceae bacterium]
MLSRSEQFDPDRAFGWIDFAARRSVIIAVSGGSDSTALLIAFKHWIEHTHRNLRIICVTVDHGLRPASAAEARHVATLCARLGVAHRTCLWVGDKPETGIAAAAREARYALLAEAARDEGTDIILTGHTANDQAETVHMRRARGHHADHPRGLAGMARMTLFDGEDWIVRPLLDTRRETLRDVLTNHGVEWIEDPTNEDENFERVGVRKLLTEDCQLEELCAAAGDVAGRRTEFAGEAASLIARHGTLISTGLVRLDQDFYGKDTARMDAVRTILACAGGAKQLADRSRASILMDRLRKGRSCLSGCLAARTKDGLHFCRERRSGGELSFADGIFDGRYRISSDAVAAGWSLQLPDTIDAEVNRKLSPLALTAAKMEPELVSPGNSGGPDIARKPQIQRYLAPFDHFLPEFDLKLAAAAAVMFGRKPYPPPPAGA